MKKNRSNKKSKKLSLQDLKKVKGGIKANCNYTTGGGAPEEVAKGQAYQEGMTKLFG